MTDIESLKLQLLISTRYIKISLKKIFFTNIKTKLFYTKCKQCLTNLGSLGRKKNYFRNKVKCPVSEAKNIFSFIQNR